MPQSKPENVEKCSLSSKQNIKLKEKKKTALRFQEPCISAYQVDLQAIILPGSQEHLCQADNLNDRVGNPIFQITTDIAQCDSNLVA